MPGYRQRNVVDGNVTRAHTMLGSQSERSNKQSGRRDVLVA